MTAGRCSPEMARAIVNLILGDEGVATVYNTHRNEKAELVHTECTGCGHTFLPSAFGRQFCSRSCYDQHLARHRALKPARPKKPPREQKPGALGPGRRLPAEIKAYLQARRYCASVPALVEEVDSRFGIRIGITTVYRVFRQGSA